MVCAWARVFPRDPPALEVVYTVTLPPTEQQLGEPHAHPHTPFNHALPSRELLPSKCVNEKGQRGTWSHDNDTSAVRFFVLHVSVTDARTLHARTDATRTHVQKKASRAPLYLARHLFLVSTWPEDG